MQSEFYGQAERAISNGQLSTFLYLHIRPINWVGPSRAGRAIESDRSSRAIERSRHNPFPHFALLDHGLKAIRWFAAGFEQPPAIPHCVNQQIGLELIGEIS